MNGKGTFLRRPHSGTALIEFRDGLRDVALLQVLHHLLQAAAEDSAEDFHHLFALHVVNSLDDAGQKEPNPDVKISLELVSGSFLEPLPHCGRLVQMSRGLLNVSTESPKLSEAVVLVARIDFSPLIG